MKDRKKYIWVVLVLVASILRLWQLGSVPPSPDWDEAALGYNAYSLLQTGKDEYGESFPLILRSFDDYKPALYAYLIVPFIPLRGLDIVTVRLPSALFGIATVIAVYFLVRELLRQRNRLSQYRALPLIAMGVVAVAPWHIQFSRIAFEANIGLSLNVFGLLFFLVGLRKRFALYLSAVSFALAPYVYQSEKLFMPLLGLVLILTHLQHIRKHLKQFIGPCILFLLLAAPFYITTLTTDDALLRAQGVSVFSDQTHFLARSVDRLEYDARAHNSIGKIYDNRRITYAIAIIEGYISHFDLNWLLVTGDQPRHQPPRFGHLYLIELPFLIVGLYALIFSRIAKRIKLLLFGWLLITPLPAAFTTGVPHPIRTIHFVPLLHIIISFGIVKAVLLIKNKHTITKNFAYIVASILIVFNMAYFLDSYFIQYNYESSREWQYGYENTVAYIEAVRHEYDRIVVTNKPPLDQSYIFFLYYTQYDPASYIQEGGTASGGFEEDDNSFSVYSFRELKWDTEVKESSILYVGRPEDFPYDIEPQYVEYYLDGTPAIYVVRGDA